MTVLLRDFPIEEYKDSLAERLQDKDLIRIGSEKSGNKYVGWFKGCMEAISKSKSGDTIVVGFDLQAVMCWWICKLTFRRRNIVCINIMIKDGTSKKSQIIHKLYKAPFSSNNFVASANSREYISWLNERFRIKHPLFLLHDSCRKDYVYTSKSGICEYSYIFIGGGAARDWSFAFELAKALPEKKFQFVMNNTDYEKFKGKDVSNVDVYHNIPYSEFMERLVKASIVCLPISVQTPAGLIVLFQAGANHKPVVVTSTMSMREYVNEDRGECLSANIDLWVERIRYIDTHQDEFEGKADNFYKFLFSECSEDQYAKTIRKMIAVFEN